MQPKATLKFMATLTAQLGDQIVVGDGPKGSRVVIDVPSVSLVGDKLSASVERCFVSRMRDFLRRKNTGIFFYQFF